MVIVCSSGEMSFEVSLKKKLYKGKRLSFYSNSICLVANPHDPNFLT